MRVAESRNESKGSRKEGTVILNPRIQIGDKTEIISPKEDKDREAEIKALI